MNLFGHRPTWIALALAGLCAATDVNAEQSATSRIDEALKNITASVRLAKVVGCATVWDGNKYVQCRRLHDCALTLRGRRLSMKHSFKSVLNGERLARLAALGWVLDTSFGNHVRMFPADTTTAHAAECILQTLTEVYGADLTNLETATT